MSTERGEKTLKNWILLVPEENCFIWHWNKNEILGIFDSLLILTINQALCQVFIDEYYYHLINLYVVSQSPMWMQRLKALGHLPLLSHVSNRELDWKQTCWDTELATRWRSGTPAIAPWLAGSLTLVLKSSSKAENRSNM